jgi:hypothetical protein
MIGEVENSYELPWKALSTSPKITIKEWSANIIHQVLILKSLISSLDADL